MKHTAEHTVRRPPRVWRYPFRAIYARYWWRPWIGDDEYHRRTLVLPGLIVIALWHFDCGDADCMLEEVAS